MTSPDGSFYFGDFAYGKKAGVGTMRIHLDSNDLIFVGTFVSGEPSYGTLYNPSMSLMGVTFGKVMRYRNGGFYDYFGNPLGSKPADNNHWFSGGWGEALGSAITQGTVMHSMGQSPIFASDDPLIDRVCDSNPLIAGAAKNDRRCD